jgi:lysophospholipase L1-like esterase
MTDNRSFASRLSRRRALGLGAVTAPLALAGGGWTAAARQASPVASPIAASRDRRSERWVGAWAAAPRLTFSEVAGADDAQPPLTDRTLRQVVRPTIGGAQVRVRLTNAHAEGPVTVSAAHIAILDAEASIVPESDRVLTFGGQASLTLPPDAVIVSDPVALAVSPLEELVISLYLPGTVNVSPEGLQTTYISPAGDFTGEAAMPVDTTARSLVLLTGVDVAVAAPTGAVVAPGASNTEGVGSTPGANRVWTDVLAERLLADPDQPPLAVLNVGISGNRLLHDGFGAFRFATGISLLARFDRDVLAQPGVTHVILMQGLGDIGAPVGAARNGIDASSEEVSADDIIAGQRILIERAHEHGLVVIGGTLTPWGGSQFDTPETEAKRQAVNDWIRTGGAFDAVVDFDAAVRDPAEPARLRPEYDSGDHGHLNDAGNRAMGEAIDLALLRAA